MRRKNYFNFYLFLIFVVLMSWLIACAVNPVTGKKEFMLLTESDEIQLCK